MNFEFGFIGINVSDLAMIFFFKVNFKVLWIIENYVIERNFLNCIFFFIGRWYCFFEWESKLY